MVTVIYEIPSNIRELFKEVENNGGYMSYRIINYGQGMSMDNTQSMQHFVDFVEISDHYIEEDSGTRIVLNYNKESKRMVIDSGGLGDFYSHSFDCYWEES